jgi:predicted DsbA family dithiol-disulfide isomerase
LIWLAGQHDLQDVVVEALFRGYFTEGRDVGSLQVLVDLAAEAGLGRQVAEEKLSSDDGKQSITTGQALTQQYAVTSVPFFIVNNAVTLSGAQAPETFIDAFKQAIP